MCDPEFDPRKEEKSQRTLLRQMITFKMSFTLGISIVINIKFHKVDHFSIVK